jgi:isopenicillin-N epimerase
MLGSMATIPLPEALQGRPKSGKIDPEQLALYDQYRIEVPFVRVGMPEKRYFRISAQIYNTMADYERLGQGLIRIS